MCKCIYFKIYELVSEQVYNKYGESAWRFFDPRLLETLDWVRLNLNKPIIINNWYWGGHLDERGLRCNLDSIVKNATLRNKLYCSAHTRGMAVDFTVEGMTAQEVRNWLINNKDLIPSPIRLEKDVSWVHLDVVDTGEKIYLFTA